MLLKTQDESVPSTQHGHRRALSQSGSEGCALRVPSASSECSPPTIYSADALKLLLIGGILLSGTNALSCMCFAHGGAGKARQRPPRAGDGAVQAVEGGACISTTEKEDM